jgi:hypothetical protein
MTGSLGGIIQRDDRIARRDYSEGGHDYLEGLLRGIAQRG